MIGKEPGECIFIDDPESNITVAQSVGITGLQFYNSGKLIGDLKNPGIRLD